MYHEHTVATIDLPFPSREDGVIMAEERIFAVSPVFAYCLGLKNMDGEEKSGL